MVLPNFFFNDFIISSFFISPSFGVGHDEITHGSVTDWNSCGTLPSECAKWSFFKKMIHPKPIFPKSDFFSFGAKKFSSLRAFRWYTNFHHLENENTVGCVVGLLLFPCSSLRFADVNKYFWKTGENVRKKWQPVVQWKCTIDPTKLLRHCTSDYRWPIWLTDYTPTREWGGSTKLSQRLDGFSSVRHSGLIPVPKFPIPMHKPMHGFIESLLRLV